MQSGEKDKSIMAGRKVSFEFRVEKSRSKWTMTVVMGVPYIPTFQDGKVKNVLSPAVNRDDLRRLNYNKTVFGPDKPHCDISCTIKNLHEASLVTTTRVYTELKVGYNGKPKRKLLSNLHHHCY